MLPFMQLLQHHTIRPYVRYAHHMLQALNIVPRVIFDHEFVWIEQGQGALTVGTASAPYKKGDLLLIPPGTVHTMTGPFEAHKAIHFDWEHRPGEQVALDQQITESYATRIRYNRGSVWLPNAIVFHSVGSEMISTIDEIVNLYQSTSTFRSLQLQTAFSKLLLQLVLDVEAGRTSYVEIAEAGSPSDTVGSQEMREEISGLAEQLMTLVEETDVSPGMLNEITRRIPLSEAQIRRLFKRQFGHTPHMYLTLLCMNKARKLLLESTYSVQDIAFACGHEDAKYFSRQFRQLEGISPAAYRELQMRK